MRVDVCGAKRDHAQPVLSRPIDLESLHRAQAIEGIGGQVSLPRVDSFQPDPLQVPNGLCESHRAGDVRGARFVLVRQRRGGEPVKPDFRNHLAAALPGRHVLQQFPAPPQRSDAGGREHLVAAEGVEVATEGLHVDLHVRCRLRSIDEAYGPRLTGLPGDFGYRVHDSERVGNVGNGDEAGPVGEQSVVVLHHQRAVGSHIDVLHRGPGASRENLPGNQVGVVLHLGEEDLVSLGHVRGAPRPRNEIDLRRSPQRRTTLRCDRLRPLSRPRRPRWP